MVPHLGYCERSRAKRGELAERRLSSRKRESSCTGIWENKTIEYFENEAYLKYGSYNKKYVFSPTESISEVNRPDPTRPGPARPGPTMTLFERLYLG